MLRCDWGELVSGYANVAHLCSVAVVLALLMVAAALAAVVAGYAQGRIPRFTAGRAKVALARAILATVGLAVGWLAVAAYPDDRLGGLLAFIIGFGVVHIPAALILFIKGQRRAGRS